MFAPDDARPAAMVAPPMPEPIMTMSGWSIRLFRLLPRLAQRGIHQPVRGPIWMLSVLVSV